MSGSIRPVLLAWAGAGLLGCSTLISKGPTLQRSLPNEQLGAAFSGVRLNLHSWYCLGDTLASSDYPRLIAPFAAAEAAIDLPLSLVGDLLILPVDLALEAPRARPPVFEPPCLDMRAPGAPRRSGLRSARAE